MNRLVLVGNGFDLAHGLKTSYRDFITDYWMKIIEQWKADEYGNLFIDGIDIAVTSKGDDKSFHGKKCDIQSYCDLKELINKYGFWKLTFKNKLLQRISESSIANWVDIEQEYYDQLKKCLKQDEANGRLAIKKLNDDLSQIENLLVEYLRKEYDEMLRHLPRICERLVSPIEREEVSLYFLNENKTEFSFRENMRPTQIMILNFNYTNTINKYIRNINSYLKEDQTCQSINIHGSLANGENPVIFGYGDEIGEDYQKLENLNDVEALRKVKSIQYLKTENYRQLMSFIELAPYQIFIWGHSCGLSDRTLLSTVFEHKNCISIKPFYHRYTTLEGIEKDNFIELAGDISRNFRNKVMMRDRVVNRNRWGELMK